MLYLLQNLGWITKKDRERLQAFKPSEIASRLGLEIDREEEGPPVPLQFVRLALEAYRGGKISLGKFANMLRMSRQEAMGLLKSLNIPLRLGTEDKEALKREQESG
ncbi:MAG: UPF0175 family protein [Candidatus Tectomicrobia bacterium]|uniref:UPF0175 family protein n=1 Tax=Tectimicrobiota bacterium TaxID=2528274 RepID=A0A932GPC3_UNCTE|nr:UPF0175 family protein [Candidatus Tectomicrobia bacterium]